MSYKSYTEPEYCTPEHLKKAKKLIYNALKADPFTHPKQLRNLAKVSQTFVRQCLREFKEQGITFLGEEGDIVALSSKTKKTIKTLAEKYDLDEKEELFVFHYMKCFNATTAAARAGYPVNNSHAHGSKLLKKKKIQEALKAIRADRDEELLCDGMDVIRQYMKIAFADITDVCQFKDDLVLLRSSKAVDGTLINEIKQSKDGVSVKMEDRLQALKRLEVYFGLSTDVMKVELEKVKLLLQIQENQNNAGKGKDLEVLRAKMADRKKKNAGKGKSNTTK